MNKHSLSSLFVDTITKFNLPIYSNISEEVHGKKVIVTYFQMNDSFTNKKIYSVAIAYMYVSYFAFESFDCLNLSLKKMLSIVCCLTLFAYNVLFIVLYFCE